MSFAFGDGNGKAPFVALHSGNDVRLSEKVMRQIGFVALFFEQPHGISSLPRGFSEM
jgi:hypothetical protein